MRPPHHFLTGNLVLRTPDRRLGDLRARGPELSGPPDARKVEVGERLEALAYVLETDFQILRISRAFDAEAYERARALDPRPAPRARARPSPATSPSTARCSRARRDPHRDLPGGSPRRRVRRAARRPARRPRRLLARARRPTRTRGGAGVGRRRPRGAARRRGGGPRARPRLPRRSRIGPRRVAGLIRRAYTRGLGEPDADEAFAPQALAFLDPGGEERFRPYAHDLLRLHESRVTIGLRSLAVDSERGAATRRSWCSARCPRRRPSPVPRRS